MIKGLPKSFLFVVSTAMISGCNSPKQPVKNIGLPVSTPTARNNKTARQVEVVRDVEFSPDNSRFAVAKFSGEIEVWDARARRKTSSWIISQAPRGIGFLDANRLAISGSASVQIWDVLAAKLLKTVTGPGAAFTVSPKRNLLATEREIWRVTDWKKLVTIHGQETIAVRAAAISPDGTILVTAAWDSSRGIEGFDVKTGRSLWLAGGDQQGNVAFSPNGRSVGISTTMGIVLLNPKTGHVIRHIGHSCGGKFRFLSDQIMVQKNVDGDRKYQESRITYAVSTGKILTATPTLENEVITPNGCPRFRFVGAEKSVQFE